LFQIPILVEFIILSKVTWIVLGCGSILMVEEEKVL
jgi:hypothetical protein